MCVMYYHLHSDDCTAEETWPPLDLFMETFHFHIPAVSCAVLQGQLLFFTECQLSPSAGTLCYSDLISHYHCASD